MQNMCIALLQDQVSDTTILGDKWCWGMIAVQQWPLQQNSFYGQKQPVLWYHRNVKPVRT